LRSIHQDTSTQASKAAQSLSKLTKVSAKPKVPPNTKTANTTIVFEICWETTDTGLCYFKNHGYSLWLIHLILLSFLNLNLFDEHVCINS
jgi:hypothetical protein